MAAVRVSKLVIYLGYNTQKQKVKLAALEIIKSYDIIKAGKHRNNYDILRSRARLVFVGAESGYIHGVDHCCKKQRRQIENKILKMQGSGSLANSYQGVNYGIGESSHIDEVRSYILGNIVWGYSPLQNR